MNKCNHIVYWKNGFIILFVFFILLTSYSNSYSQVSTPPAVSHATSQIITEDTSFEMTKFPESNSIYITIFVLIPLYIILSILFLYVIRHCLLAISRLFGTQRNLYAEIMEANWPSVTILVPAHNEETVITDLLMSILKIDYPAELLQVIIVNDRSTDKTGTIVDEFVAQHPNKFVHFNRREGTPGKSAALFDVMPMVKNAITLVFDADYIPGPFLIKQLIAPFFDPEVGSVMGRVVPGNTEKNLLTRLVDIERSGGYQVNQQARENWQAIPQYGGTDGGIRTQALNEVGGWDGDILAEDTEVTFRLYANHWITAYQNHAECIELVPETWLARIKQIKRWAKGHNQVMCRYFFKTLFNRQLNTLARYDGALLLCIYLTSPLLVLGWLLYIIAYLFGAVPGTSGLLGFLLIISFSGAGNFTIFYEIAIALHLDNLQGVRGNRMRLLPLIYMSFFVSMFSITMAVIEQMTVDLFRKSIQWDRTHHPARKQ